MSTTDELPRFDYPLINGTDNIKIKIMPNVFVGIVVADVKMYCIPQFIAALKKLSYPKKHLKIMFCDNSSDDTYENFVRSIEEADFEVAHVQRAPYTRQALVDSRNYLLNYFKEHKEYDYFFSLECDVIPPVDVIERLIADDKDIVSGVYLNGKVYQGVQPQADGNKHDTHTWIPMSWFWPDETAKEITVLRPMSVLEDMVPSRLFRVQSTGLGCLMIKREALNNFPGFRYERENVACDDMYFCIDIVKICEKCNYREEDILKAKWIKECPKCKHTRIVNPEYDTQGAGYEIWLDTYIWCRHMHKEWSGAIKDNR